jgi:hypothetical protein
VSEFSDAVNAGMAEWTDERRLHASLRPQLVLSLVDVLTKTYMTDVNSVSNVADARLNNTTGHTRQPRLCVRFTVG